MNKGKQDQEIKDTKQTKKIKFIIKPSKEGVTILHKMQQVSINVAKLLSQQLKGKIKSVNDGIIDLIGPANETEVIINGKKVNALLDTGSQITSISESYYKNNLSNYPLVPVDIPNLKVEQARWIIHTISWNGRNGHQGSTLNSNIQSKGSCCT